MWLEKKKLSNRFFFHRDRKKNIFFVMIFLMKNWLFLWIIFGNYTSYSALKWRVLIENTIFRWKTLVSSNFLALDGSGLSIDSVNVERSVSWLLFTWLGYPKMLRSFSRKNAINLHETIKNRRCTSKTVIKARFKS